MALYRNGKLNQNNMERSSAGVKKHISFDMTPVPMVAGDIVILGALPKESITLDMRIIITDPFSGGGFELGYYDTVTEAFAPFANIDGASIIAPDTVIVIPMQVAGHILPDGTAYTGERGSLWVGETETTIALRWAGATPTFGECEFITTHTYYGTKDGSYGLDTVPMTPYNS